MFVLFENWLDKGIYVQTIISVLTKWSDYNKKYLKKWKELILAPLMETSTEEASMTISTLPFR